MTLEEAKERCWLEVDLDALCENYLEAKRICKEETTVIPVLKADAYGLGAQEVGKALFELGARLFAVAAASEAEALCAALPEAEVLLLGRAGREQMTRLIEKGVKLTLYSPLQAREMILCAQNAGKPACVHIKIDTGLHRLGFEAEEIAREMPALLKDGWLRPEGAYTHLGLHTPKTDQEQFEKLEYAFRELENLGCRGLMVHALDSIGMVRYPQKQYSAVRVGAWLYGVTPSGCPWPEKCRSVAKLKCRVAQIHQVKKGELVGYDDEDFLKRDSRILTLSAGYVDGVARRSSGMVEIRGSRAKVQGLACMDQMMVDGTDLPHCEEGDEVCFFGDSITIDEYAAWGGLNRNEALSTVGTRVPRVYKWRNAQWTGKR